MFKYNYSLNTIGDAATVKVVRKLIKDYKLDNFVCYNERQLNGITYNELTTTTALAVCVYGCKVPFISEELVRKLSKDELYEMLKKCRLVIENNVFYCARKDNESLLAYLIRGQYFKKYINIYSPLENLFRLNWDCACK